MKNSKDAENSKKKKNAPLESKPLSEVKTITVKFSSPDSKDDRKK